MHNSFHLKIDVCVRGLSLRTSPVPRSRLPRPLPGGGDTGRVCVYPPSLRTGQPLDVCAGRPAARHLAVHLRQIRIEPRLPPRCQPIAQDSRRTNAPAWNREIAQAWRETAPQSAPGALLAARLIIAPLAIRRAIAACQQAASLTAPRTTRKQ